MAMAMVSCPSSSASLAPRHICSPSAVSEIHHHAVAGFPLRRTTFCRLACDGPNQSSNSVQASGNLPLSSRRDWSLASTAQVQGSETAEEELPAKLREIVQLFQGVTEQRARYQQLLYYGQKLKPLAKEFCIPENKVQGCVSQVWVTCKLAEDGRMYFEANSDSALTKGLAALLVEGLSGATPLEILKVSPGFMEKLGLQQSLTPSRSNGFLNMLRLMQKRTMQAFMESAGAPAAASPASTSSNADSNGADVAAPSETAVESNKVSTVKESIERKLSERLAPVELQVEDVSHQHAGHAGAPRGSSETHFNVKVVSDGFQGLSLVKRHRLIYGLLQEELQNGLHALSLITKTPAEVSDKP